MKKPTNEETIASIKRCYSNNSAEVVLEYMKNVHDIDACPRSLRTWLKEWGVLKTTQRDIQRIPRREIHTMGFQQVSPASESNAEWLQQHASTSANTPAVDRPRVVAPPTHRPDSPLLGPHVMPIRQVPSVEAGSSSNGLLLPTPSTGTDHFENSNNINIWNDNPDYGRMLMREPSFCSGHGTHYRGPVQEAIPVCRADVDQRSSLLSNDSGYGSSGLSNYGLPTTSPLPSSSRTYVLEGVVNCAKGPVPRDKVDHSESSLLPNFRPEEGGWHGHDMVTDPYDPEALAQFDFSGTQVSPSASSRSQTEGAHLSDPPFAPPHAYPSTCPMAAIQPYNAIAAAGGCTGCKASEAHYLACTAYQWRNEDLYDHLWGLKNNINCLDNYGNSCLHFLASTNPTLATFRLFRAAGAQISIVNHNGQSILHVLDPKAFPCVGELVHFLNWTTKNGFNPLTMSQRTKDGHTALHSMIGGLEDRSWAGEIFGFFKSTFLDVNARDRWGLTAQDVLNGIQPRHDKRTSETPLNDLQLQQKDLHMLEIIKRSAREPFCEDKNGRNALGCLAYLTRLRPDVSALGGPQNGARFQRLQGFLNRGLDVNHYDNYGSTVLHSFTSRPRLQEGDAMTAIYIRALVDAGADVKCKDRYGNTALHLACRYGLVNCAVELIGFGSELNATNDGGRTVLAEARSWIQTASDHSTRSGIQQCMVMVARKGGRD